MCIAPALITGYTLVEQLVPAGARTEAFTWLTGAVALGQAAAVDGRRAAGGRGYGASAGFLVPAGGHRSGPGDPAGAAFAARSPRAHRSRTVATWRRSPRAGDGGLIRAEYVTMDRR